MRRPYYERSMWEGDEVQRKVTNLGIFITHLYVRGLIDVSTCRDSIIRLIERMKREGRDDLAEKLDDLYRTA